jgi:hypothetical protein
MSLYREVGGRGRRLAFVVAAVLLAGVVAGFALGRATASQPTFADNVARVQATAREIVDALELIGVEYPQGGDTEEAAARSAFDRAVRRFAEIRSDLALLDRTEADEARGALTLLGILLDKNAPAARVGEAATAAEKAVREAARLR